MIVKGAVFMTELNITAIFLSCTAILIINGIYAVKTAVPGNCPRVFLILPVDSGTSDIEFIVRRYIYRVMGQYPDTLIIFYDMGASSDTVQIFERLMEPVGSYCIVNNADFSSHR